MANLQREQTSEGRAQVLGFFIVNVCLAYLIRSQGMEENIWFEIPFIFVAKSL